MSNDLWPVDIQAEEVLSPMDILESQAGLLSKKTNGLLGADVECHETEDRRILGFEVFATVLDTKVRLFEVHLSPEFDYPAAFVLPNLALPDYLIKERYVPTVPEMFKAIGQVIRPNEGRWVENEWVATSPQEFSEKMAQALDDPSIKGRVLSLIARSQAALRLKRGNGEKHPDGTQETTGGETE